MKLTIFTLFPFVFATQLTGQISSQGPKEPSTVYVQYSGCLSCLGTEWINQENADFTDSLYTQTIFSTHAFCFMDLCYFARGLMPRGYGFTIPTNAIILGIRADVLRKGNIINCVVDTIVKLFSNNSNHGVNKADPEYWPDSAAWISYGDSTDLWGASWTPSDINMTDFGLLFTPMNKSASGNITAFVDDIRFTVWYQAVTGVIQYQTSGKVYQIIYDQADKILRVGNNINNGMAIIEITSETGQLLKVEEINLNKETLVRIDLPSGIYAVRIIRSGDFFTKQIIVNR